MNTVETTQRNATRNQSTADFERKNLFLFGNRYTESVYNNNTEGEITATAGLLVVRDVTDPDKLIPATSANLANVVGILNIEGEVVLTADADINCNLCLSGDIDSTLLTLPATVTLNTVVGAKLLKDILTGLGFVLHNVVENSKFDN